MTFEAFYRKAHGEERTPFPWQARLARCKAMPAVIDIPTGCGKTSVLDVAVWRCLERDEAKRIVYVVDRRLVVDDVFAHAQCIGKAHGLEVVKMRGGMTFDEDWILDLAKPVIVVSTVDQVGSRLLFRGYGLSWRERAVHAGLLGTNSIFLLDEVHLSRPFATTLESIATHSRSGFGEPLELIQMSATPDQGATTFGLDDEDRRHPVLHRRMSTHKTAKLVVQRSATQIERLLAKEARTAEGMVVGVVVNRVETARSVFRILGRDEGSEAILLTGRIRPYDREALLKDFLPRLRPGRDRSGDRRLYVVATQTVEVGADLDFDSLVTEAAPLTSLLQRFGRLDRLGDHGTTNATIVLRHGSKKGDPIYGDEIGTTWTLLSEFVKKSPSRKVDFGLAGDLDHRSIKPPMVSEGNVPTLDESVLRILVETHPHLAHDVNVHPFLHGDQPVRPAVSIVWRQDLLPGDEPYWKRIVKLAPPLRGEALPVPIGEARGWLSERSAVRWRGKSDVERVTRKGVSPGDILMVPSDYGGSDAYGWLPGDKTPVVDVGNEVLVPDRIRRRRVWDPYDPEISIRYPEQARVEGGVVIPTAQVRGEVENAVITLADHTRDVVAEVGGLVSNLPKEIVESLAEAARWHDEGKKAPGFQVRLHGGEIKAARAVEPLAKSGFPVGTRKVSDGLPRGWRHEIESALRMPVDTEAGDRALVRHLILAHHGHARPWIRPGQDLDPFVEAASFIRLTREHGWWGLAYLEAVLRIADRRASIEPGTATDRRVA